MREPQFETAGGSRLGSKCGYLKSSEIPPLALGILL